MFKSILRSFFYNLASLYITAAIIPGFTYGGGLKTLAWGALLFMTINILVVPLLRVLLLPLNLLTFGFFAWVVNVIALYILTVIFPEFRIVGYTFSGLNIFGIIIPSIEMNTLHVAVISSFLIGFVVHFLNWLSNK